VYCGISRAGKKLPTYISIDVKTKALSNFESEEEQLVSSVMFAALLGRALNLSLSFEK
jgi:hypothetical protein